MAVLDQVCAEMLLDEMGAFVVMGRGLGLQAILYRLVELHCDTNHLIFLLNTSKEEEQLLLHELAVRGVPRLPTVINNERDAQERAELYLIGGVLLVTARILIVDLLSERVPIEYATGILVSNAHRVTEVSNVAFILRIVRQRNKRAFIKALSDEAPALTNGFGRIEKLMRSLYVRNLQLWPRFHMVVNEELHQAPPQVDELSVALSGHDQTLQRALLEAVDSTLRELRDVSKAVDTSQLTVENALFRSFDTIVRMQLEPVGTPAWARRISITAPKLIHP